MNEKKIYFPMLESEIAKHGIRKKDIAEMLEIGQKTFCNKLKGKTEFNLTEIFKIVALFPDVPFPELFSCEKNEIPSENRIELLPERINDTQPLTEVILDNAHVKVSEIERDQNGNPIFYPFG